MRTALAAILALAMAGGAGAQESEVQLKDGPGKDKAMQCVACHSLDYIQMNSRFLDKAGWAAEVNKMINAYGAPIPKEDVDTIASYLAQNYGKPADKQAGSAAISAGASPRRR
jgi:Pyruvate/2-oxoacid:ferredoxin oxidoreductase gamma subunit